MRFYGAYKTVPGLGTDGTPRIDFIEFQFPDDDIIPKFVPEDLQGESDLVLSCDWDESEWDYNPETGVCFFKCNGVYINDIYANHALEMFLNAAIYNLQVFTAKEVPKDIPFKLMEFVIKDDDGTLCLSLDQISSGMVDIVGE